MAAYVYAPLPPSGSEEDDIHIRLLKLSPAENSDIVSCTVTTHPLSIPPEYEAVSYIWGSPTDKTQIACDGQVLAIPNNLNDFLVQTMAKGMERTLWVDCICINQGDPVEKSSQVAAMSSIYRKAKRALVWLGKEYEASTLGLVTAQNLAAKYIDLLNNKSRGAKAKRPWYRPRIYEEFFSVWDPKWAAFFRIFDRPYWTRAWVVQEVVVSQNQWIICGDTAITWQELLYALVYCFSVEAWIFEFYGSRNANVLLCMYMSQTEVANRWQPVHYKVLLRHRMAMASDARDKVFAYHGISAHKSLKDHDIKPDYELTTKELYVRIAVSTLRGATDLDFLDIPRVTRDPDDLPSWVPNWVIDPEDVSFSLLNLESMQSQIYTGGLPGATKDSEYTPRIDEALKRLELTGYEVDRIASVTNAWEVQDTSGYSSLLRQARILQKNQRFVDDFATVFGLHSRAPYPTGESREEVTWQTCVTGIFQDSKDETRNMWKNFQKRQYWLSWITTLRLQGFIAPWLLVVVAGHILREIGIPNPEIAFRALTVRLINRRAIGTVGGYVGLVPKIAEVGDYIMLAKGGKLPLVLRPKGKDWELIGDCYVHGMMKGELWEEKEGEKGKCEELVLV